MDGPVAIVGGGIAGLSVAFALCQRGVPVAIYDKAEFGRGTTWAAAGMLAPVHELEFQELDLLRLGQASLALYPQWETLLGDIGLERTGTLEVALSPDDVPYLERLFQFQQQQGLAVEWLSGTQLRVREPALSPTLPAGVFAPGDWQVDNRKLVGALVGYLRAHGAHLHPHTEVLGWAAAPGGIALTTASGRVAAQALVLATGAYPVPESLAPPQAIKPIKGQMVALAPSGPQFGGLRHVVRIRSRAWGNAYLVPKTDRLVVGSTAEEVGADRSLTAGGLLDVLRKAYAAVPGTYDLPILDLWTGHRPATASRQPLVARHPTAPVVWLNGLYRHGVLLGPVVGQHACGLLGF